MKKNLAGQQRPVYKWPHPTATGSVKPGQDQRLRPLLHNVSEEIYIFIRH